MFRILIATMLIACGITCFANDNRTLGKIEMSERDLALSYIAWGNENLFAQEYTKALESYEQASKLIANSNDALPEQYLISLGRAIAYDNLNLCDLCQVSLGRVFLTLAKKTSFSPAKQVRLTENEYKEGFDFLKKLSSLAHSSNIRGILLALTVEVSEYEQSYEEFCKFDESKAVTLESNFLRNLKEIIKRVVRTLNR